MKMEIATRQELSPSTISALIMKSDLSKLSEAEKVGYYKSVCERVGIDWATKPFDYLVLQGKQTLYLNKSGAEQLNRVHNVSMSIMNTEQLGDIFMVTARAVSGERHVDSTGAVAVKGLNGDALANAYMRAETKAKRRATLSLLGLAMLDETEVATIPGAQRIEAPAIEYSEPETFDDSDDVEPPITVAPIVSKGFVGADDLEGLVQFGLARGWSKMRVKSYLTDNFGSLSEITYSQLAQTKAFIIEDAAKREAVA